MRGIIFLILKIFRKIFVLIVVKKISTLFMEILFTYVKKPVLNPLSQAIQTLSTKTYVLQALIINQMYTNIVIKKWHHSVLNPENLAN